MTAAEVKTAMGAPSWVGQCGTRFPVGRIAGCQSEWGYSAALAPLNPTYYLVWFGTDGRVVKAVLIGSP
jgi:hypothetical protein